MSERHKLPQDFPMSYRGLDLNEHRDQSGDPVREYVDECYDIVTFDPSPMSIRDQVEGLHVDSGADVGVASKEFRRIAIRGLVKSRTAWGLEDRIARLLHAFDIEEAIRANPSTEGLSPFTFWCPTAVLPAGAPEPLVVQEMFIARPRGFPVTYERKSQGLSYNFAVELLCADPRRYIVEPVIVPFSTAAGWVQGLPNWPVDMGVATYPVVTLVLSGNGASNLTISDGTTSFVLNLSAAGAGTFTIDMKTKEIKKGSTPRNDLRSSGTRSYLLVPPGGADWEITNRTNLTSAEVRYHPARS